MPVCSCTCSNHLSDGSIDGRVSRAPLGARARVSSAPLPSSRSPNTRPILTSTADNRNPLPHLSPCSSTGAAASRRCTTRATRPLPRSRSCWTPWYVAAPAACQHARADIPQVENEDEFERWEALVTRATELEGGVTRNSSPSAIELIRNTFNHFLAKFPLFFGYWKKYADLEFAIGGTETAEMVSACAHRRGKVRVLTVSQVYERGVSCIPSSVDLWTHYCAFKMDTSHDNDIIRE